MSARLWEFRDMHEGGGIKTLCHSPEKATLVWDTV